MTKIWHYTSHHAALNIWKTQSLRLSSIDFLNDSSEQLFFLKELDIFLSSYECKESRDLKFLKHAVRHRLGFNPSYISCFSLDGDDVSQWERYGDNARGVAICFNKNELDNIQIPSLGSIKYLNSGELQQLFQEFHKKHNFAKKEWSEMVLQMSLLYKQPHFKSEQEVRIIMSMAEDKLTIEDNFFAREDCICPCVFLDFPTNAVLEIKMGPKARSNAIIGWQKLTDPNFRQNNINKWGNMADDFPYKISLPITQSQCTLV